MDFTQPSDSGDVTFIVEGRKIYANKGVLAITSDVFKAMFTSDFAEKKMTEIPLPDKTFADFLQLMQIIEPLSDQSVNNTNVESLLHLAHEYRIHRVIERCEKVLGNQPPSIHNLILADKFSLPELRQVFFNYLKTVAYTKLEEDPEFELVDKDRRIEVFERHSMFQKPSIDNLFLAEKYHEPEVYEECLKYLKDTELAKLKGEHGFENLQPSTLIDVLSHKVEMLEPKVKQFQTVKTKVLQITKGMDYNRILKCPNIQQLYGSHFIGSSSGCVQCLQYWNSEIANAMKTCK